jgi:hypothetical protein
MKGDDMTQEQVKEMDDTTLDAWREIAFAEFRLRENSDVSDRATIRGMSDEEVEQFDGWLRDEEDRRTEVKTHAIVEKMERQWAEDRKNKKPVNSFALLKKRSARLCRLVDLDAPEIILAQEVRLLAYQFGIVDSTKAPDDWRVNAMQNR